MARIRSLKPEFWTDSVIVTLSPFARLLFQGCWNFADEWGVLEDEPDRLKLQILPADPVSVRDLLDELIAAGRIRRATTPDGVRVLVIPKFRKHNITDKRLAPRFGDPATFAYNQPDPPTPEDMSEHAQTPEDMSADVLKGQGVGNRDKGQGVGNIEPPGGGSTHTRARARARPTPEPGDNSPPPVDNLAEPADSPAKPAGNGRARRLPEGWHPTGAVLNWHNREFPHVPVADELAKFTDHWRSTGIRRVDWDASWRNWIRRAARDYGPPKLQVVRGPPSREAQVSADIASWNAIADELERGGQ